MKKGFGIMNKIISLFIFLASFGIAQAQDNEIYVDQSGATANIDFEQLGGGNLITGLSGVSGT